MDKFDTHGGHYEPQGYMRVNAGGSHDENPNGGVQVGVDPEGTPNLLEEGEPVYNDYVYSDNITAEEDILKKHNIPSKYSGKLYSEIADSFVDEVAETPLDPIANNGLNAMLVRLAESQEEQKSIKEQKDLEDELSKLSPEELDELEQMLSEQEMVQPQENPEADVPEMVQEPMENQEAVPQVPMMAAGGIINRFYTGGPKDDISELLLEAAKIGNSRRQVEDARIAYQNAKSAEDARRFWQKLDPFNPERALLKAQARLDSLKEEMITAAEGSPEAVTDPIYVNRWRNAYESAVKDVERVQKRVDKSRKKDEAKRNATTTALKTYESLMGSNIDSTTLPVTPAQSVPQDTVVISPVDPTAASPVVSTGNTSRLQNALSALDSIWNTKAAGGPINRFDGGGLAALVNQMGNYTVSRNRGNTRGNYQIDPNFYKRYGFNSIDELEASDAYKNFTRYVLANSNNADVQNYLRALDAGTPDDYGVPRLFEGDKLRNDWADTYIKLRNDKKGGIYHFMGDDPTVFSSLYASNSNWIKPLATRYTSTLGTRDQNNLLRMGEPGSYYLSASGAPYSDLSGSDRRRITTVFSPDDIRLDVGPTPGSGRKFGIDNAQGPVAPGTSSQKGSGAVGAGNGMLPTWPRYAGAVTSGLLGLYNAFQEPDKYTIPNYNPVLPQGRMHLIDPVYNPIDQNQLVNDVLASSAGTTRAINNSGLGAATQATLLAQDYNTGRNLGTALTQAREANNQRLNQVIAQRNQNAGTLGNFNYGQSRDRAQILNDAAVRNLQNDILRQRLNYEAEGQKYAAIQQQIDSVAQALSDIGRENAAMNMINGDEAYAYALSRLFDPYYKGHITKCGGPIKKTKK